MITKFKNFELKLENKKTNNGDWVSLVDKICNSKFKSNKDVEDVIDEYLREIDNLNAKKIFIHHTIAQLLVIKDNICKKITFINTIDKKIKHSVSYLQNILDDFNKNDENYKWFNAIANNDYSTVKIMLDNGFDINAKKYINNNTGLIDAIYSNRKNIIKLFLQHPKLNPNSKNNIGFTPLMEASFWNRVIFVDMLLNLPNINVNIQNDEGDTALMIATKRENCNIVEKILNHENVDVDIKNNLKQTAKDLSLNTNKKIIELFKKL